jgi:hypothetical protein
MEPFLKAATLSKRECKARMPGDINIDGRVDIRDIAYAAQTFGSYPEHP